MNHQISQVPVSGEFGLAVLSTGEESNIVAMT